MRSLDWRAAGVLLVSGMATLVLASDFGPRSTALAQAVPTAAPSIVPTTPAAPLPSGIATPPPPLPTATPPPLPTATPAPRGRRRGGSSATAAPNGLPQATATPTSPAYSSLDGNWEVQIQRVDTTQYSNFTILQDGNSLTGTWFHDGQKVPLDGTYDGRLFHFTAKDPKGSNLDFSGYVENATDMVGIVDDGKGEVPFKNPLAFTAEHRGRPMPKKTPPPKG